MFPAMVEYWRGPLTPYASDLPMDFLLAWIQRESGGNPCSYTTLRESGIFQLMPPDNTNTGGTTEAALRAACSGSSQSMARQLTDAEIDEQVRSGIQYVQAMRAAAHRKLDAAGVPWGEDTADFWKIVKLQHAYPGPTATWLNAATQALGRAPANWDEMVQYGVPAGGYQGVIDNANWVGSYGVGFFSRLADSPGSILGFVVGLAGFAGIWYWMRSKRKLKGLSGSRGSRGKHRRLSGPRERFPKGAMFDISSRSARSVRVT